MAKQKKAKLNARQARFASKVAAGAPQRTAYVEAGYAPSDQHASRLAKNGKVAEAIDGHLAQSSLDDLISKERVARDLDQVFQRGMVIDQLPACNRSAELRGRLNGLFVERVEVRRISQISVDVLLRRAAGDDPAKLEAIREYLPIPDGFDET